jgi:serine/threonine protein kinase/tetratricopeptide (TPR) repeat protein
MPGSDSHDYDLIDRLAEEFAKRFRDGERPSVQEYCDKYPHVAADLREMLPALAEVEEVKDEGQAAVAVLGADQPARLGEYRVLREVGRGGMGVVYEAVQESLGRHVALKVLPARAGVVGNALERFRREARAAAQLHHTNIVPVFGVGEADGVHYYAMQFIAGQGLDAVLDELRRLRDKTPSSSPSAEPDRTVSLASNLASGRFPAPAVDPAAATECDSGPAGSTVRSGGSELAGGPAGAYFRTVARLGAQVSDALGYAHAQGVVHRDVKPSNLLLDAHGMLWVTDFGLAQVEGAGDLTRPGDVVGTIRYMAPERFAGKADARSDVYGLGLTLYELLTLKPGYDDPDRMKLIDRIRSEDPPRPRTIDARIPRDLELIVRKATARHPAERYCSAGELAADLGRFLRDEPVTARRPTVVLRASKWARRNRKLVAGSAAMLVAALATAGGSIGWAVRDREARKAEDELIRAARDTDTDVKIDQALRDAALQRDHGDWPKARAAIEGAEWLSTGGGSAASRERVRILRTDLRMAERLEEARVASVDYSFFMYDRSGADSVFAEAFRDYGIDMFALDAPAAAARIADSAIREHLVAVLDDWLCAKWCKIKLDFVPINKKQLAKNKVEYERLRAVTDMLVPDECCRRVRDPEVQKNRQALVKLAGRPEVTGRPSTAVFLAHLLWVGGTNNQTVELLRAARQRRPDDFAVNCQLGQFLFTSQPSRPDEGLGYMRVAIALRPGHARLHVMLGDFLKQAGRLDQAIAEYRTAYDLDPKWAYSKLVEALKQNGKWDEALTVHERVAASNPTDGRALYALARAYAETGHWAKAIAEFHKGIQLGSPPDVVANCHRELAWLLATCPDVEFRDADQALHNAQIATQEQPSWPDSRALGAARYRKGAWTGAIEALTAAKGLTVEAGGPSGFILAMAYWRMNQRDDALKSYDAAVGRAKVKKGAAEPPTAKAEWEGLRTEAAKLLGIVDAPGPSAKEAPRKKP